MGNKYIMHVYYIRYMYIDMFEYTLVWRRRESWLRVSMTKALLLLSSPSSHGYAPSSKYSTVLFSQNHSTDQSLNARSLLQRGLRIQSLFWPFCVGVPLLLFSWWCMDFLPTGFKWGRAQTTVSGMSSSFRGKKFKKIRFECNWY